MALILDPYHEYEFEHEGVVYAVRGLTTREKLGFMPYMISGKALDKATIESILSLCLCGWKDGEAFDTEDRLNNIDRIPFASVMPIVGEVIRLSKLGEEESKNSQ